VRLDLAIWVLPPDGQNKIRAVPKSIKINDPANERSRSRDKLSLIRSKWELKKVVARCNPRGTEELFGRNE